MPHRLKSVSPANFTCSRTAYTDFKTHEIEIFLLSPIPNGLLDLQDI